MTSKQIVCKNEAEGCEMKNIIMEGLRTLVAIIGAFYMSFLRFFVHAPLKSVKGEIVLVTGSGSGIGRQLVIEFSRLGAVVVLWDINEESNEETAQLVNAEGGTCHVYTCDVGSREEVYAVADRVKTEVGDISILVNNAGIVSGKKLLDCTEEMIERTFNVNLLAHFWTVKAFLPAMFEKNHGHIINMSSSCGVIGLNGLVDYSASKFGVVGFTEVLNYEIVFSGHSGVNTSLVCPMWVRTGMFEGCRLRFPALNSPLEVEAAVNRIMRGILTNEHVICLPRTVYFFNVMRTFLPVEAMLEILRFMGVSKFMNRFVGHQGVTTSRQTG
ncbi:hypothetical protein ScPMuIL_008876 [Solemya velum]